jgi:hypothetical protein
MILKILDAVSSQSFRLASGQISPVDGVVGSQTATVNIAQASLFTLTCGAVAKQITVGLVPIFQEI